MIKEINRHQDTLINTNFELWYMYSNRTISHPKMLRHIYLASKQIDQAIANLEKIRYEIGDIDE